MDYNVLKTELTTDPLGLGYGQLLVDAPGHVVDLLNAPNRDKRMGSRFVTARTVLGECGLIGGSILDALTKAAETQSTVKWALTFLSQDAGLDVGEPATQYQIAQLEQYQFLSTAQASALRNLALRPCSRAEKLGLGHVTEADIRAAMAIPTPPIDGAA
jgi:hypothetical protein